MNINKLFDKYLDITTDENKTMHIENHYAYIKGSYNHPSYNGNLNMMKKENNIYVLKEVYSMEKNRLRYSYVKFENVKSYVTIEKDINGDEKPIFVIEHYDKVNTYIGSIGKIKKINSDKLINVNEKSKDKPLILKLIKRNKKGEIDLESLINAA